MLPHFLHFFLADGEDLLQILFKIDDHRQYLIIFQSRLEIPYFLYKYLFQIGLIIFQFVIEIVGKERLQIADIINAQRIFLFL
jgi:hypothetical protein